MVRDCFLAESDVCFPSNLADHILMGDPFGIQPCLQIRSVGVVQSVHPRAQRTGGNRFDGCRFEQGLLLPVSGAKLPLLLPAFLTELRGFFFGGFDVHLSPHVSLVGRGVHVEVWWPKLGQNDEKPQPKLRLLRLALGTP